MRIKITQELIVDIALEIAKEKGIEAVTMANIARQLKIKPPSLYNHFLSLHDIKQEMAKKAQLLLLDYLLSSTKNKETDNKLKAFAIAYYQFACEHPGYYAASIIALDSSIGLSSLPSTAFANMMKEMLEPYHISDNMLIHTIRALRGMLHGLIDLFNKGGFKLDVSFEETLEHSIDLFIRGIEAK